MNEKINGARENGHSLDYLSKIINEVTGAAATLESSKLAEEKEASTDTKPTSAQGTPDFISTILSNPELLSKLPSLISSIKPIMEMLGRTQAIPTQSNSHNESTDDAIPTSKQEVSAAKTMGDSSRRAALLCAMKPYLNRERQEAIDYIIKISRLGDVLKSL